MRMEAATPLWVAASTLLDERSRDFFRRRDEVLGSFDPEAIHDLRVASRRLREGLLLFAPCYPEDRLAWLLKQVRKVTRLLGDIRNGDEAAFPPPTAEQVTVATSAVRQAANGDAFVKAVAAQVGLKITVISGEEEAELAIASALHNCLHGAEDVTVELFAGRAKGDLFEAAFGKKLVMHATTAPTAGQPGSVV